MTAGNYQIRAQCSGTCKKTQVIRYEGFSREWVETQAGLLDGTSPLYVIKPGPDSPGTIGRCETCGGGFTCTVEEAS